MDCGNYQDDIIQWIDSVIGGGGWSSTGEAANGVGSFQILPNWESGSLIYKLYFTPTDETDLGLQRIVIATSENHIEPLSWAKDIAKPIAIGWLMGKRGIIKLGYSNESPPF